MGKSPHRSYEKIRKPDLRRLLRLARAQLDEMLFRRATAKHYRSADSLIACLCQGTALHYAHGERGVNDWDVVFFFRTNRRAKFPVRWIGRTDFGSSRFGRNPDDGSGYVGRRIDVMGRDIPVPKAASAEQAIVAYLSVAKAPSARRWAARPMVALTPAWRADKIIWPPA